MYDIAIIRDKLRKLHKGYAKKGWTRDSEIIVEELYEYLLDDYDDESLRTEVHYVAITRPEERLLVLFKQKRENAKVYIDILYKQVQKIVIDEVQQHINDVIEIVKI